MSSIGIEMRKQTHLNLPSEAIDALKEISLDVLPLSNRAKNSLRRIGISSALDAILEVLSEFKSVPGIGVKTREESIRSIDELLAKLEGVEPDVIVNAVDPRESYFEYADGDLVSVFPAVVDLYFRKQYGNGNPRNLEIIRRRFGLADNQISTLEELGYYYDVTRERIRQIEAKEIKRLRSLLNGDFKPKDWLLDKRLADSFLRIQEKLWSAGRVLSEDEMFTVLGGLPQGGGYLALLMEVLGYRELPNVSAGFRGSIKRGWYNPKKIRRTEIENLLRGVDVIFDAVDFLDEFDFVVKAKKRIGRGASNEALLEMTKICPEIEHKNQLLGVSFVSLRNAGDKAYRILSSKNKPVHYSELCREINYIESAYGSSKLISATNLKNQMIGDERFISIGKSGEWGLAAWGSCQNITIVDAMESVLHKAGTPLSIDEIIDGVRKIRPDASRKSFVVYLGTRADKFSRTTEGLYALAAWNLPRGAVRPKSDPLSDETFHQVAKDILEQGNPMPLPEFIEKISNKTGLKSSTVRLRVLKSPVLKTRKTENRFKEIFVDPGDLERFSFKEGGGTLRDRVQREVRAILCDSPNLPFKKGELYRQVNDVVPCQRPTFYRYLSEMKDIKQFNDQGSYLAVYEFLEESEAITINLGEYHLGEEVMARLVRPIDMLNPENVDIGLFELGLIFEEQLKKYLIAARDQRVISVGQKDLKRLSAMIDCVVREKVVTKGHHLNTLREERNLRAHEHVPSSEEKRKLFNKAHYVAELFVRYISFFDEKRRDIESVQ
jgi:DNA-directed RNA polymerase delta subunit